jgi:hypothetical protein
MQQFSAGWKLLPWKRQEATALSDKGYLVSDILFKRTETDCDFYRFSLLVSVAADYALAFHIPGSKLDEF